MDPHKVNIDLLSQRDQLLRRDLIDPHLRELHEKNVAGMDIHTEIRPLQILCKPVNEGLHHGALLISREDPVHVQVKHGNPSCDRIDPQRVQRRIDVHDPLQVSRLRLQSSEQLIADELAFQFIAMRSRHDRDPFFLSGRMGGHDPVLPDRKLFIHRQLH